MTRDEYVKTFVEGIYSFVQLWSTEGLGELCGLQLGHEMGLSFVPADGSYSGWWQHRRSRSVTHIVGSEASKGGGRGRRNIIFRAEIAMPALELGGSYLV